MSHRRKHHTKDILETTPGSLAGVCRTPTPDGSQRRTSALVGGCPSDHRDRAHVCLVCRRVRPRGDHRDRQTHADRRRQPSVDGGPHGTAWTSAPLVEVRQERRSACTPGHAWSVTSGINAIGSWWGQRILGRCRITSSATSWATGPSPRIKHAR